VVPAPLEPGQPLPDGTSLRELAIPAGSYADGRAVLELHLPQRALIVLVNRDGTYIVPTGSTRLRADDGLLLLAPDEVFGVVRDRLTAPAEAGGTDL
jgi:cell volume regulation protein A